MSRMWQAYNTPEPVQCPQVFDSAEDAPPTTIRPTVPRERTVRAQAVGNAAPGTINAPGSVRLRRQGASAEYVCPRRDDKPLDTAHDLPGWNTSRPSQSSTPPGPRRSLTGPW